MWMYFPDKSKFLKMTKAIGRVISKDVKDRAEVSVTRHRINDFFCIYFPEDSSLQTYDPDDKCTVGDIVLIKKLPDIRRQVETHKIEEIVYKVGHIIDPLTGLRVEGDKYLPDPVLSDQVLRELRERMAKRETFPKYKFEVNKKEYLWESRNTLKKDKKNL